MPERESVVDSREALRLLVQVMARQSARKYLKNHASGQTFDKAELSDSTGSS